MINQKLTYYFYLVLFAAIISGCKKMDGYVIPGSVTVTTSGTGGTTGTGGSTGTGGGLTTTSADYQPFTTNSSWKYVESGIFTDTLTYTMTGATTTINGKLYHNVNSQSKLTGNTTGYYSFLNHQYTTRATASNGITIEQLYLIDTAVVGAKWTAKVSDNGLVNGIPAQIMGTVIEKGISKTVAGTVFNNVIHTTLHLQYDYGTGFSDFAVYDYYVAKGVGVIEGDAELYVAGTSLGKSSTVLISYLIK